MKHGSRFELITCPKCGKPAWKLADYVTNQNMYGVGYLYSRYRHPKKQYGKIKTCYIFRKRVCMSQPSKDKFDPDIPLSGRLVTKCLHSQND